MQNGWLPILYWKYYEEGYQGYYIEKDNKDTILEKYTKDNILKKGTIHAAWVLV